MSKDKGRVNWNRNSKRLLKPCQRWKRMRVHWRIRHRDLPWKLVSAEWISSTTSGKYSTQIKQFSKGLAEWALMRQQDSFRLNHVIASPKVWILTLDRQMIATELSIRFQEVLSLDSRIKILVFFQALIWKRCSWSIKISTIITCTKNNKPKHCLISTTQKNKKRPSWSEKD